jgi:hypothetical protein
MPCWACSNLALVCMISSTISSCSSWWRGEHNQARPHVACVGISMRK